MVRDHELRRTLAGGGDDRALAELEVRDKAGDGAVLAPGERLAAVLALDGDPQPLRRAHAADPHERIPTADEVGTRTRENRDRDRLRGRGARGEDEGSDERAPAGQLRGVHGARSKSRPSAVREHPGRRNPGDEGAPIQMQLRFAGADAGSLAWPGTRATEDKASGPQTPESGDEGAPIQMQLRF